MKIWAAKQKNLPTDSNWYRCGIALSLICSMSNHAVGKTSLLSNCSCDAWIEP